VSIVVVGALGEELAHLPSDVERVVTGVGKALAAASLARRLADGPRPGVVVNMGTAGAIDTSRRGVVEVGYVTQHDFPYAAIERLVDAPVPRGYVLRPDTPPEPAAGPPTGATALASGDVFVSDAAAAAAIFASGVQLVDMEAFAYAATCAAFGVAFRCVKVVSDSADEHAGAAWLDSIDGCARALAEWAARHLRDG
jgi:adenosylhomocysteine nucleosidase